MNFSLGSTCWHVVGYVNGDIMRPVHLCGWRGNEYVIGGSTGDVVRSEMPVCKTCDRATGHGAAADVWQASVDLCPTCNEGGLIWDPRVDGNVVTCSHDAGRL